MIRPTNGRTGPRRSTGFVITIALTASLLGCASDRHQRPMTTEASAFDRFLPPTLGYGTPVVHAVATYPGPSYGHVPAGPPPASPPPLPVVRLDPKRHAPFANGQEPPIRMGRAGQEAPPASTRGQRPLSYARIDARGNLIGGQGQVLYRAGLNSPPVDTVAPVEEAPVLYDTTHASPRQLVAQSSQVPRVLEMPANAKAGTQAPAPGVHPVANPRVRQFEIAEYDLPDDRGYNVRVDSQGRAVAAAPAYGQAAGTPQQAPAVAQAAPAPQAYAPQPVPVAPAPQPAAPAASDHPIIKQISFKGSKERKVQRLYKRGMKDLRKKNYRLAESVFKKLIKRYPQHELADNALYWMAEGAYAQGDWLQAMTWFQDVILRYPEGNKLPDAMLKSALCYAKLGDTSYAVQMLTEVETLFGGLPVAQVARQRRMALSGGM